MQSTNNYYPHTWSRASSLSKTKQKQKTNNKDKNKNINQNTGEIKGKTAILETNNSHKITEEN